MIPTCLVSSSVQQKMKNHIISSIILIISTVLSLFLAEGVLRLLGVGYGNGPIDPDPVLHHANPKDYQFMVHTPSKEYGGHIIYYDHDGYRFNPNNSKAKLDSEKTRRIAFMGDSFTAASQETWEDSYVGIVEKQLKPSVEVKNYGVSSYSPVLYVLQWKGDVAKFKPTDVVVQIFSNDISDDESYYKAAQKLNGKVVAVPGGDAGGVSRFFRQSYLLRFLRKTQLQLQWALKNKSSEYVQPMTVGGVLEETRPITDLTSESVLELRKLVHDSGARFHLMVIPSKARSRSPEIIYKDILYDNWLVWASSHRVELVDLKTAFEQASNKRNLFFDQDIHLTVSGNKLVAEVLIEYLRSH